MKKVKVQKEFAFADTNSMQVFFEEQHREGYKLCQIKGDTYYFEPCAKQEYVYYVLFRDSMKEKHDGFVKRFEEAGWQLVLHTNKEWYYFCKPRKNTFSESERQEKVSKKAIKRKSYRRYGLSFVMLTAFCALANEADLSNVSRPDLAVTLVNIIYVFCVLMILLQIGKEMKK